MNAISSTHLRLVFVTSLLGVAALGASFLALGRRPSSTAAQTAVKPLRTTPAPHFAGSKLAPARVKQAAPAKPSPVRPNRAVAAVLRAGFPAEVAAGFRRERVLVVVLHSRGSRLDQMASKEAAAGARRAGAGFVSVDLTAGTERSAAAVARKLGIVDTPTILVVRRSGEVSVQLTGFVDHETVAQAAELALRGQ